MSAPAGDSLTICPHCWNVNRNAPRLCGRCGADMTLALQESGGLRRTAPVQSPVPVHALRRIGPLQRLIVVGVVVILTLVYLVAAFSPPAPRPAAAPAPTGR